MQGNAMRKFVVLLAVGVLAAFGSSATVTEAGDTYAYQVNALRGSDTSAWSIYAQERGDPQDPCPGGSDPPTPTAVAVDAVPIVVTSTTANYFVLYVSHELNADTTVELPVLVKRGEAGRSGHDGAIGECGSASQRTLPGGEVPYRRPSRRRRRLH